jgi:dimethylglycine dehydrogenase
MLLRVSFAGELGWEVHCAPSDRAPAIWDAVTGAGAKPFGMFALNSLRIEKGYRAWKGDLSTDYSLLQGGLERFIRWDKAGFSRQGRASGRETGGRDQTLCHPCGSRRGIGRALYVDALARGPGGGRNHKSGAWGYRVGGSVALGMLRADLAAPGTRIEVDIYGSAARRWCSPMARFGTPTTAG